MTELYAGLVAIGALVLLLGLVSEFVESHLPVSIPLLSLLVGVLLGPGALGVFDPSDWGPRELILEEAARLTLAIGLMATALRLPPRHFFVGWRVQAVLIGVLMPLMWGVAALIVYLSLGVPFGIALLIGAILTPTDPIVASALVTSEFAKKRLPDRIRHHLSAEAGANDGLAQAFVMLAGLVLASGVASGVRDWAVSTLLVDIAGGVAAGILVGYTAGRLLAWGEAKHTFEQPSFLAYTVALALLALGAAQLAGTNGVLTVFVAGVAFDNVVGGRERAEEAEVQETVNQFFTLPIFALIGLVIPVQQWMDLGWRGAVMALGVLALRRLPAMLILRRWMPALRRRPDALFFGWFGPIGVSALLYAMEALRYVGDETVWTVSSLVICASVAAHGITAMPFIRLYARHTR